MHRLKHLSLSPCGRFPLSNQEGFLLVSMMFLMILLAVTIFSINYYSTTQQQMAANQELSMQKDFDRYAVLQESLWQLSWPGSGTGGQDLVGQGPAGSRYRRSH